MKNKYLLLFFGIFIFMIIPKNVYAETNSARIYYDEYNVTGNSKLVSTAHFFANMGSGTLKSNLSIYLSDKAYQLTGIQNTSLPLVRQIVASNGSKEFVCDIGTSSVSYTLATDQSAQNTSQLYYLVVNYSYSCDMEITDYGLADITVYYLPQSSGQPIDTVSFGPVFSFTQSDNSAIVNSQNNTTNAINDNWNNFNNADLDSSDKESPNTDNYTDYQTAENNLFDKMDEADTDSLNVAIDSNSATWVWDRITEWLGTHALLMSFLVSMLSIGIIKMALGR